MADLRNRPSGGREQYKAEPEYLGVQQVVGASEAAEAAVQPYLVVYMFRRTA